MKISYMGRRLNGKFDSLKAAIKRAVRFTVRWSMISGTAYAIFMAGALFYSTDTVQSHTTDLTPQKLEALKGDLVDRLAQCESAGKTADYGIVTYDNNQAGTIKGQDVFSIGILQWKVSTVKSFVKQRDGKEITNREAMLLALDPVEAKALAKYAIFETTGGIYHWRNCSDKHDLAAEVAIIKRLTN